MASNKLSRTIKQHNFKRNGGLSAAVSFTPDFQLPFGREDIFRGLYRFLDGFSKNSKRALRPFYFSNSFYFFDFALKPFSLSHRIDFLGYIGDVVADHILDSVFINLIFFGLGYKVFSTIVCSVFRIES